MSVFLRGPLMVEIIRSPPIATSMVGAITEAAGDRTDEDDDNNGDNDDDNRDDEDGKDGNIPEPSHRLLRGP